MNKKNIAYIGTVLLSLGVFSACSISSPSSVEENPDPEFETRYQAPNLIIEE